MLGADIEVRPTKKYIAFRRRQGFLGVILLNSKLKALSKHGIGPISRSIKKGNRREKHILKNTIFFSFR